MYVEDLSFRNDIYIMLKTGVAIVVGEKKYLEHPEYIPKNQTENNI